MIVFYLIVFVFFIVLYIFSFLLPSVFVSSFDDSNIAGWANRLLVADKTFKLDWAHNLWSYIVTLQETTNYEA